jgi:peptide deformylase
MAIKKIVLHPNPILTTKCEKVVTFDNKLKKLLNDMFDTMYEADGVGLAAPQIGISKQIAVIDTGQSGKIELINPIIIEESGEQVGPEGCLSFPSLYGDVSRANVVKVEAQNRKGKTFTLTAEGFFARAVLHEIDHLQGVLFTEKVIRYYEEGELDYE